MLPELRDEMRAAAPVLGREFSSADRIMTLAETRALLAEHKLLVEDRDFSDTSELLR